MVQVIMQDMTNDKRHSHLLQRDISGCLVNTSRSMNCLLNSNVLPSASNAQSRTAEYILLTNVEECGRRIGNIPEVHKFSTSAHYSVGR